MCAQFLDSWFHRITQVQQGFTTFRAPRAHQLCQTVVRFGREGPNVDISLIDDQVSRFHATITPTSINSTYKLSDDESKNGTFVNGVRLQSSHLLNDGDIIRMGNSLLVYEAIQASDIDFSSCPPSHSLHSYAASVRADRLAQLDQPVLLLSQMGTYRTVLAHRIHDCSARPGRFVSFTCSDYPHLSSTLLGENQDSVGLIHQVAGGTLFFEEASQIPLPLFNKLLSVSTQSLDVRFILAAHPSEFETKTTSALCHRIFTDENELVIQMPPLRERRIEILQTLLSMTQSRLSISAAAAEMLLAHHWPSNHIELERFVAKLDQEVNYTGRVTVADLLPSMKGLLPEHRRFYRPPPALLETLLNQHGGDLQAVASSLSVHTQQLHRWLAADNYRKVV